MIKTMTAESRPDITVLNSDEIKIIGLWRIKKLCFKLRIHG